MEPTFSVGIRSLWDELRHMPAGGVWWLNVDRQEDAVSVLNQTIASQEPEAKVAVISHGIPPREIVKVDDNHGPEKIRLFSMPLSKDSLKYMRRDLMCSLKPEHYFFILLLSEHTWENKELRAWLKSLAKWTRRNKCCFLVLNTGIKSDKQRSFLVSEHRLINGLASMRYQGDICRYDVSFWCNEKGVSAQQQLELQWQNEEWRLVETANANLQPRSDEKQILSHSAILEGAPPLSEYWQLFGSNDALFDAARNAQASTVIFSLAKNNQIDDLAHQIHTLRRQRGSAMKIVVREINASLRATDERLLLGCGATLIIPWNAPLSRSLTMIESIQGQQFGRHVPEDINLLIEQMQPLKLRGYQPWDVFCNAVCALINNTLLPQDGKGVMVALRPVPSLRAEQALTLCHPNRLGDIVTMSENRITLFLPFCRINDLDIALSHIFPLPADDIFSNRMVWYEDNLISAEIVQMQAMNPEKWTRPLDVSLDINNETHREQRNSQAVRRIPTPTTLLSTTKREQAE